MGHPHSHLVVLFVIFAFFCFCILEVKAFEAEKEIKWKKCSEFVHKENVNEVKVQTTHEVSRERTQYLEILVQETMKEHGLLKYVSLDWVPTKIKELLLKLADVTWRKYIEPIVTIMAHPMSIPETHPAPSSISSSSSVVEECGMLKLPLRWDVQSEERYVNFFVKRYVTSNPPETGKKKGQFWLLQGGPGGRGSDLHSIALGLSNSLDGQYDIYVPDHRGTGFSQPFWCSLEEESSSFPVFIHTTSQSRICKEQMENEWGKEGVKGFSTRNAAEDVVHVIKSLQPNYDVALVHGISYGTYWLNTILEVAPDDLIQLAVADSVVPPAEMDFFDWDSHFIEVGNNLTDLCMSQQSCAQMFESEEQGGNVVEAVKKAFNNLASEKGCHPAFDLSFRSYLAALLGSPNDRYIVFPLIYRINRCNSADYRVLDNISIVLLPALKLTSPVPSNVGINNKIDSGDEEQKNQHINDSQEPQHVSFQLNVHKGSQSERMMDMNQEPSQPPLKSPSRKSVVGALQRNIVCSEICKYPEQRTRLQQELSTFPPLFTPYRSLYYIYTCQPFGTSGTYHDPNANRYATSFKGQLLTLQSNGGDPQTAYGKANQFWRPGFDQALGERHLFIEFPYATHAIVVSTYKKSLPNGPTCGHDMIVKFAQTKNLTQVDTSCLKSDYMFYPTLSLRTPTLSSQISIAVGMFPDIWESGPLLSIREISSIVILLVFGILLCCGCCGAICCGAACVMGITTVIVVKRRKKYPQEFTEPILDEI